MSEMYLEQHSQLSSSALISCKVKQDGQVCCRGCGTLICLWMPHRDQRWAGQVNVCQNDSAQCSTHTSLRQAVLMLLFGTARTYPGAGREEGQAHPGHFLLPVSFLVPLVEVHEHSTLACSRWALSYPVHWHVQYNCETQIR